MAYEPTVWKNREVEKPRTFQQQNNPDGTVTLIPKEGNIIEPGTPIIADNMNKIEQGIAQVHELVGGIEDLQQEVTTHFAEDAIDAHNASNISFVPPAGMTATDVQQAIAQAFQQANDIKGKWAGVVGSPLLSTDTQAQLQSKTQTIKNTLATNLSNKGQPSVGTETLTDLVNKVPNINTGKKFAAGTVTSNNTVENYKNASNGAFEGNFSVIVTGLDFTPSFIEIYKNDRTLAVTYNASKNTASKIVMADNLTSPTGISRTIDERTIAYANPTGFKLPAGATPNIAFNYRAYE